MTRPWFCNCCLRWFECTAPVLMIVPGHYFQGQVCQGCAIKDGIKRHKIVPVSVTDRAQQTTGLTGVALTAYLKGGV